MDDALIYLKLVNIPLFQADSFSPHESYQLGRKSNTSLSEMSRDAPSSRQHSKYSYDKVCFYICSGKIVNLTYIGTNDVILW